MNNTLLLKNKDTVVASVSTKSENIGNGKYLSSIYTEIAHSELLPIDMQKNQDGSIDLKMWLVNRWASIHRENGFEILQSGKSEIDVLRRSFALSLNDTFWVVPDDQEYKWCDYNLYENDFDSEMTAVAFNGIQNNINKFVHSPEFTTSGALRKAWIKDTNKEIWLLKSGSKSHAEYRGREPYAEFYAAQIAELMGFCHVPYELVKYEDEIVSACKLFTSQDVGYMPIFYYLEDEIQKIRKYGPVLLSNLNSTYSKKSCEDLLFFDALICNTDRHYGNYGMLFNTNTLETIGPAPIFDNGASIFNKLSDKATINYIFSRKSFGKLQFSNQAEKFLRERHQAGLEKLVDFKFQRHPEYNIPEENLNKIETHLHNIAEKCLNLLSNNDEKPNTKIT